MYKKQKQKILMVVASPLQVINSMEWVYKNDFQGVIDVFAYSGGEVIAKEHLYNTIEHYKKLNTIVKMEIKTNKNREMDFFDVFWNKFNIIVAYLKILVQSAYDYIIIGEFRGKWIWNLASFLSIKNIILVDDGSATLLNHNKINNSAFRYEKNHSIEIFSIFKIDQKWKLNKLSHLYNSHSIIEPDMFDLIGTNFSESSTITIEEELSVIEYIKFTCGAKKLNYLPHRHETKNKINQIKEMGYTILENSIPVELFYSKREILPAYVGSFFSTITFTIPLISSSIKIFAYSLPRNISKRYSDHYAYIEIASAYLKSYSNVSIQNIPCNYLKLLDTLD